MRFLASLELLPPMIAVATSVLDEMGCDPKVRKQVEVSLEEALVNVIRHAYRDYPGEIEIECRPVRQGIEVVIKDWGEAFDPRTVPLPKHLPLEERKEGGLGVFFIQQLMDSVDYARENGVNVLRLFKRVSQ